MVLSDTIVSDDPSKIRTCDRTLRRRMLYPAELLDQNLRVSARTYLAIR